jgi:hypothetical protein
MSRSNPVELATRSFGKQADATSFFRVMLNRYLSGERNNGEDGLDLAALLERHTGYVAKVGCGVSHFSYADGARYTVLSDHTDRGSGRDFSYPYCFAAAPAHRKQEVSQAFRRVVRFDLLSRARCLLALRSARPARISSFCRPTGPDLNPIEQLFAKLSSI